MLVLGIETSCDETAAAVVDDTGRVWSDVVQSQVELHAEYGGIIPELAARDHLRNAGPVVTAALAKAGIGLAAVDAIAVTNRPGLVGALLVGVQLAKGLAWAEGKPLVGVDHLVGHLLAVHLRRADDAPRAPLGPHVALLASGGHTATYRVDGKLAKDVTELGATRDDAAGEAFDKVAKLLGLGYPGGPVIDRLAQGGDPSAVKLPRPMSRGPSRDFSFSGIKTHLAAWVREHGVPSTDQGMKDVCASFQAAVTTVLADKLIGAAREEGVSAVTIGGGVAANRELRRRVTELSGESGLEATLPELASCTDNAAMIAYAGLARFAAGERDGWDLVARSRTALPRATRKGRGARD